MTRETGRDRAVARTARPEAPERVLKTARLALLPRRRARSNVLCSTRLVSSSRKQQLLGPLKEENGRDDGRQGGDPSSHPLTRRCLEAVRGRSRESWVSHHGQHFWRVE